MHKLAIIDLGSNSVRMIILRIDERGAHKMIEQAKVMVRLSQGTGETGELQPEPIERTIETLHLFQRLMTVHGTNRVIPVATAAVRDAANQKAFLDRVEEATGLSFTVLTGDEEATYDYLGVINTLPLQDFLLIDTGGDGRCVSSAGGGSACVSPADGLPALTFGSSPSMTVGSATPSGRSLSRSGPFTARFNSTRIPLVRTCFSRSAASSISGSRMDGSRRHTAMVASSSPAESCSSR